MLEHIILRNMMRIAANARRRSRAHHAGACKRPHGFGHILDILTERDGLTQQQIAQQMDIRPQSVSEAIAAMEQQGLVCRQTSETDRRSSVVYITPEGRTRQAELLGERIQNARRIMEPLSVQEKDTLLRLLQKITDSLQEEKEET